MRKVALGRDVGCVLLEGGELRCWHAEDDGSAIVAAAGVRNPSESHGTAGRIDPKDAVSIDLGGAVEDVAVGMVRNAICAVRHDGAVFCWGRNVPAGILGYDRSDHLGDDESPLQVGPVPFSLNDKSIPEAVPSE